MKIKILLLSLVSFFTIGITSAFADEVVLTNYIVTINKGDITFGSNSALSIKDTTSISKIKYYTSSGNHVITNGFDLYSDWDNQVLYFIRSAPSDIQDLSDITKVEIQFNQKTTILGIKGNTTNGGFKDFVSGSNGVTVGEERFNLEEEVKTIPRTMMANLMDGGLLSTGLILLAIGLGVLLVRRWIPLWVR